MFLKIFVVSRPTSNELSIEFFYYAHNLNGPEGSLSRMASCWYRTEPHKT